MPSNRVWQKYASIEAPLDRQDLGHRSHRASRALRPQCSRHRSVNCAGYAKDGLPRENRSVPTQGESSPTDRHRIGEAFGQGDVGDVGAPDLVGPLQPQGYVQGAAKVRARARDQLQARSRSGGARRADATPSTSRLTTMRTRHMGSGNCPGTLGAGQCKAHQRSLGRTWPSLRSTGGRLNCQATGTPTATPERR